MVEGSLEEVGRSLRQRSTLPPYRPRLQLTSSSRGKANAEVRRQRELEANLIFTEANEMISHVKNTASSSVDGESVTQEDANMEIEVDDALALNACLRMDCNGQSSSQVESSGVVNLSEAVPVNSSTQESNSSPLTKKARTEEDYEFDDDDDAIFFEQLVATDAIDWESGSSRVVTDATTDGGQCLEEQGYDLVRRLREKHPETNGFRWSSEKQVKVAPKALEYGMKIIEKIKREVDREEVVIGAETSSSVPLPTPRRPPPSSRPILAPIASSIFNRRFGEVAGQEGKRKLQEEAEISQIPSPYIQPSSSLLGTPDRRLPSVPPNGSPLSQTPNLHRSGMRLGSTLRNLTPVQSTPFTSTPSKVSSSIPRTPRISLGMTPRRAASGSVPKFKTPFKDSNPRQGTPNGTQRSPDLFKIPPVYRGVSSPSVMGGPSVKRPQNASVRSSIFNLEKKMKERNTLQSMCIAPESTSISDAREHLSMEVYDAIAQILRQPKRGLKYAFAFQGQYVGREGVQVLLKQALSTNVEVQREWIDNHYTLILWKLAAYTRHFLDEQYWHWEEVCRQFKYRYEREFNCMHRSAVKRILREDCPSTRPMVLCVFEIPPFDARLGPHQTIILTDGWYKIQAVLDSVLCLAIYGIKYDDEKYLKTPFKPVIKVKQIEKADFTAASSASQERKNDEYEEDVKDEVVCRPYTTKYEMIRIKLGVKLAIQGARLESNAEGADPLKAFDHARLKIGGNCTKLAVWDSKLGFTRGSFISTIRSLSAGGGNVPLMDIVVTRIFPLAFTGFDVCPGYEDENSGFFAEWSQEEENERRIAWDKHREKTMLDIQEEQEEETQGLRKICEQLDQAHEGLSHDDFDNAIDASSCEDMLHAIITAGSASGYLALVQLIPKLRELAFKRLREVKERLEGEMTSNLQTRLGTRKVRNFRFIRFRDANAHDHGRIGSVSSKQQESLRGVLLRIWDYAERLEAGQDVPQNKDDHFMITSLTPSRTGAWPKTDSYGDIELTSGPSSNWRLVKRAAKEEMHLIHTQSN